MTANTKSIVVWRLIAHPPQRVWRALTTSELIAEWLMQNDFAPKVGHRFTFRATPVPGWSGITNCEVLEVDDPRLLSSRWGDGSESDSGLVTVVTWNLTPQEGGTLVRMEHSGFRPADEAGYRGMCGGWPRIVELLDKVAGGLDD